MSQTFILMEFPLFISDQLANFLRMGSPGEKVRIEPKAGANLQSLLHRSKKIVVSRSVGNLLSDFLLDSRFLLERLSLIHLPHPIMFIDQPSHKSGLLVQHIHNRQFTLYCYRESESGDSIDFPYYFAKIDLDDGEIWVKTLKCGPLNSLLPLHPMLSGLTDFRESPQALLQIDNSTFLDSDGYVKQILSHMCLERFTSSFFMSKDPYFETANRIAEQGLLLSPDKMTLRIYCELAKDIAFTTTMTYNVLALFVLFGLKSHFPIKWTDNVRNEIKPGKRGASHSVIDIDPNAIIHLPKPKEEPKGTGTKLRWHEVRGSKCISHRTGNPNCMDLCKPIEIDERRFKCLQCGKKGWFRKDHTRGDESLGKITKEYKVIVS